MFLFIFLMFIHSTGVYSQVDPKTYALKITNECKTAGSDSLKIEKLALLAAFYSDYLGDNRSADSIGEMAVQIAEKSHQPELLFLAYCTYIESNDLHQNYRKALDYALKCDQISFPGKDQEHNFRNIKNLASVYLSGYEFDRALESSYKLLSIAGTSDNTALKAESYLFIGQCLDGKNQKIEAFRNYLNAASLADRLRSVGLQTECYSKLSQFYNFNRLYAKATHYKLMQRDLLKSSTPVDSVALMWTEYDLQVIDINSNNNQLYERSMQEILSFATRNKNRKLLSYEIALIRTHYIEAEKIDKLRDLYFNKFPLELDRLLVENPSLYYRLKAFFCEEEHKPDSAMAYFNKAEALLQSDPNKILQSNFYHRFGQFLLRHGQREKAVEKFSKSLELAKTAFYIDYMLGAAKHLETIYAEKGDYKNAFNYSVLNKVLSDSMNNMSKKDQLLIMEIDHETHQRDLAAEQEKQSTARRHYLQYTAITIGILTVFVILIMLGSLRVPEWIIRMLGFFSFIFLFEFIILLADHKIEEITHGEPWKVLLIKIFLIAILLPLHHSIEKKVIAYLLNHKLLDISRLSTVVRIRERVGKWTGGRADGRTGGQADERTGGQADERTSGQM
ncbi:MAG: tetratricopeptide repeat protein [Bacteroidales bacterium]